MIKKILVAIDGSKLADQSLDFAIDLAKRYSAKITVLTVINSPSNYLLNKGEVFTPVSTQEFLKKIENYHRRTHQWLPAWYQTIREFIQCSCRYGF